MFQWRVVGVVDRPRVKGNAYLGWNSAPNRRVSLVTPKLKPHWQQNPMLRSNRRTGVAKEKMGLEEL